MNKLILSGRLTQDPEMRKTQSGAEMATFNLAVNRKRDRNTTDFFHCFCMGQAAKYLLQYGAKGMSLELSGECQLGSYTDKNGVKQQTVNIFAAEIDFTSKNPNLQNNQQSSQPAPRPQQNPPQTAPAPAPQNNGSYQQRPAQQQAPAYRSSAPIYQQACKGGQQQRNGYTPQGNGNGYPAPPAYQQPKTDFLDVPEGMDECPFN